MALSKISLFKSPIVIKPDLSQEERNIENLLLKEQWSLTQLGFDKRRIKIRITYIDNKLYGQYQTLNFADHNIILHLKLHKRVNQMKSNPIRLTLTLLKTPRTILVMKFVSICVDIRMYMGNCLARLAIQASPANQAKGCLEITNASDYLIFTLKLYDHQKTNKSS